MPKERSLPDDMQQLNDKRGAKDRRRKSTGRPSDDEDNSPGAARRGEGRDRRQSKNYRDLLDSDDDE